MFSKPYPLLSLNRVIKSIICLFLGRWTVDVDAVTIDKSCANLQGKNSKGIMTNCGDVREKISAAVSEAGFIATVARCDLIEASIQNIEAFDVYRAKQAFDVFHGTFNGATTPQDRWNGIVGGTVNREEIQGT